MPVTYALIASNTLSSAASSVSFSSIPNTYSDLILRFSARSDAAVQTTGVKIVINNSTSSIYTATGLIGSGNTVTANRETATPNLYIARANGANTTADTFSNYEYYFLDYLSSQKKSFSCYGALENNSTSNNWIDANAGLFNSTAAITALKLQTNSGNFVAGSSFFLYGVKNS